MTNPLPHTILGTLYIIAAPSGTGKTSLTKALVAAATDLQISISHTTRTPRPGEQHGVHYWFTSTDEFQTMIQSDIFLEHAPVFEYFYGTSRQWVMERLRSGVDVILEIDWQGARQVRQLLSESVSIFILPPSQELLRQRLQWRKQDPAQVIERRLAAASSEVAHYHEFDYLVVNDVFEVALQDLLAIVRANRLVRDKQAWRYSGLLAELQRTL